jgi:HSP20 family molecular chaperone IbpA
MPRVDMVDKDDKSSFGPEVPGAGKEDLDVSVTDHTVTMRGEAQVRSRPVSDSQNGRSRIMYMAPDRAIPAAVAAAPRRRSAPGAG